MREPDQYIKYLKHIENHFIHSSYYLSFNCFGGTYYLSKSVMNDVIGNNLDTGLLPITKKTVVDDVGIYYTDTVIVEGDDKPLRVSVIFTFYQN